MSGAPIPTEALAHHIAILAKTGAGQVRASDWLFP